MAKWVCSVCGYVYEGDAAPEKCPQCGVPASKFNTQEADVAMKKASKRPSPCPSLVLHGRKKSSVPSAMSRRKLIKTICDDLSPRNQRKKRFVRQSLCVIPGIVSPPFRPCLPYCMIRQSRANVLLYFFARCMASLLPVFETSYTIFAATYTETFGTGQRIFPVGVEVIRNYAKRYGGESAWTKKN